MTPPTSMSVDYKALYECCVIVVILRSLLWHCWLVVSKSTWPVKNECWSTCIVNCLDTTTTTTVLRPFVRHYLGEPVPEETLTHPPSWSSSSLYQFLPSTTIQSTLLVQITWLTIFLHSLFPCPLWSTCLSGALHLIFHTFLHPITCLLFTAHAHTIATCFAVVSILHHLLLVFLSTPYLELCLLP